MKLYRSIKTKFYQRLGRWFSYLYSNPIIRRTVHQFAHSDKKFLRYTSYLVFLCSLALLKDVLVGSVLPEYDFIWVPAMIAIVVISCLIGYLAAVGTLRAISNNDYSLLTISFLSDKALLEGHIVNGLFNARVALAFCIPALCIVMLKSIYTTRAYTLYTGQTLPSLIESIWTGITVSFAVVGLLTFSLTAAIALALWFRHQWVAFLAIFPASIFFAVFSFINASTMLSADNWSPNQYPLILSDVLGLIFVRFNIFLALVPYILSVVAILLAKKRVRFYY